MGEASSNLKIRMEAAKKIKFTYQDYLLTPEDKRYELIDGDLLMTPSPTSRHQSIIGKLYQKLQHFIEDRKLGKVLLSPLDVVLSNEDVVQPDLLFISQDNLKKVTEKNIQGAPDLVVEIISPGTEQRDRVIKRKLYGRFGARELWLVDPAAKNVEVIGWQGSEFTTLKTYPAEADFKSPLLEGFTFKVSELFEF